MSGGVQGAGSLASLKINKIFFVYNYLLFVLNVI